MSIHTTAKTKKASLSAVITRADGRIENLGIVAYQHRNPLIHYPMNLWIKFKEYRRKDK